MVRRGLHREFPFFFAYTVQQIIAAPTLFALDHDPHTAAATYWQAHFFILLISSALRFGIIYELYRYVLQPYPVLVAFSSKVLRWSAVLLLFVAVIISTYFPGADLPLFAGINAVDRGVALMQAGLLSLIFLFSSYFNLSWKNYAFGIAAGLGVYAAVDLARSSLRIALGPTNTFDVVSMSVYQACVFLWLGYLLVPAPSPALVPTLPEHNLQEWSDELQRFLAR